MLDGPRLPPASGRPAQQLVMFLHGFGADGNDLIELGREWARLLPDAAFVSPHAPQPCAGAPMGRQWFPISMRDPTEFWRGVTAARPALDQFIDGELARHRLTADRLALVGFSQGTMMALHVGLRRANSPAAIIGFSGPLAGPEHLAEAAAHTRILLLHGDQDDLIPVGAMIGAANELAEAGHPVSFRISHGLGHGIDGDGLDLAGRYLRLAFRG